MELNLEGKDFDVKKYKAKSFNGNYFVVITQLKNSKTRIRIVQNVELIKLSYNSIVIEVSNKYYPIEIINLRIVAEKQNGIVTSIYFTDNRGWIHDTYAPVVKLKPPIPPKPALWRIINNINLNLIFVDFDYVYNY